MTRSIRSLGQRGGGLISGIISFIFGAIISLLALRLLFRLLGASTDSAFVSWVYEMSEPFVRPFFGIFNTDIDVATGSFEIETLIAIIVYSIAAALVMRLVGGDSRWY